MAAWLRTDLKDYVRSTLSPERLERHGLFDAEAVRSLIDEHQSRRESHERQIFALMMFQKWHERFM
jgi:asparagine synthase (glutamine-hydrolysing)